MTRAMEGEEVMMASHPEIEADVSSCCGYDQTLPLANIPCTQSMSPGIIHHNVLSINHDGVPGDNSYPFAP